jgi:hypothetical protein
MANIVKLKRSAVASAIPTTAQLDLGELAINTFDGKLFLKRNNGTETIVEIGAGGGGGGGNTFLTIASSSGSTTANSTTDTLTIVGAGGVTTSITGDTLTIDGSGISGGGSLGLNLAIASGLIFF